MEYVYLVELRTSGQVWFSFVCDSLETAIKYLRQDYGISESVMETIDTWIFCNLGDTSQEGTVRRRRVFVS